MSVDRGPRGPAPHPNPAGPSKRVAGRRVPAKVVVRFALFFALLLAAFVVLRATPLGGYLTQERLIAALEELRESWWAPAVLILLYLVLAPLSVPVSPLIFAGGAVFGTLMGGLINFIGVLLGGAASFLLARGLAHDLIQHLLGDRQKRVERFLRQQGFWTLVRLRFVPIPFGLANFGMALAGVRFSQFMASSAVAFIPLMLVSSYLASAFVQAAEGQRAERFFQLLGAMGLFLGLSFLPTVLIGWQRRRRYRRVLALRSQRPTGQLSGGLSQAAGSGSASQPKASATPGQ